MDSHVRNNAIIAGSLATLVGVGLSRFAYTPLLPAVIEQGWFASTDAAYLGAANLLGYLVGALLAHPLAKRIGAPRLIHLAFASISLTFALCAWPGDFWLFFSARLISGIAGGMLMVLGPALALSQLDSQSKTRFGPLIFTGIGLGAFFAATCVPLLAHWSLAFNWLLLALISAGAGLWARCLINTFAPSPSAPSGSRSPFNQVVVLVIAAYALDAAGFIAHTVFWVDFLAREAQLGTQHAAIQWAVFGTGAICGPFIATALNRALGSNPALITAYLTKALAIGLPVISLSVLSQSLSSFWVGALTPALVSLTATRLAELLPNHAMPNAWGIATAVFALAQALSGYTMAFIYSHSHSYYPLFNVGAACLAVGALCIGVSTLIRK